MVLLAVTAVIVIWAVLAALRPLPGRDLSLATGPAGSAYAKAGERYREILARNGIRLHLVTTKGAVENVALLSDPRSGIAAGFVQAGSVDPKSALNLESLGTVFYEPVWLFCRCPDPVPPPKEWGGWRISIGPVGGAARPLALRLLGLNGVTLSDSQLFAYPLEEAAQALLNKQLEAVFLLDAWDSPVVRQLARAPDVKLLGFPRADAYVALNPDLSKLVLPRGVADLANNRPPEDTPLIASKASLAVRSDLHQALQYLLLRAATEVHSRPGIFQRAGEFPAAEAIDLPLSDEARHFYRSGSTFLQRTLPFWLAEFIQRILILVLPIAGIVYPLWSLAPKMYLWERRRRLYPMYQDLRRLEKELYSAPPEVRATVIERLDDLDRRLQDMRMPGIYNESVFNLRYHINTVRSRLYDHHREVSAHQPSGKVKS